MKNGMINLPSELRKKLKISFGDIIIFHETKDGFILVPKKDIFDLINPEEYNIAVQAVEELHEERRRETRLESN